MPKKHWIRLLILALFSAALIAIVCLGLSCPIRSLTGIPCPGCGMTRAWKAALRLDLITAFHYHPMFWSVPVLMVYCLFDGKLLRPKWLNSVLLGFTALGTVIHYISILLALSSGTLTI